MSERDFGWREVKLVNCCTLWKIGILVRQSNLSTV